MAIIASKKERIIKSKLFPVFTAANPIKRVIRINIQPA
jgi:hypothetical protein